MSNIFGGLDEEVFPMPAAKFGSLELTAEAFLEELAPASLLHPSPLDAWGLINRTLPKVGIHVHSASVAQLGNCEAVTMPEGEKETQILLREDVYEALEQGGRIAHRALCTFAHELGHAILHVKIIRLRKKFASMQGMERVALRRVARSKLKAYEDPEWQAYAIGGCICAPRKMIRMLTDRSAQNVSIVFGISESMAQMHMKRLKL